MKKLAFVALLAASFCAEASGIKSLSQDRMAELDKIIAQDKAALSAMHQPGANQTMLARDQNRRYLRLADQAKATFGEGAGADNSPTACASAIQFAHEYWMAKVQYDKSKSAFDKDWMTQTQRIYADWRATCNDYLKTLR